MDIAIFLCCITLSDWGSIGNIILGIASVFTAIVTAYVLCKQYRLQREQHQLEKEKLNAQQMEHQPRFQCHYTDKELIIKNEGCELSSPICAKLFSMLTVHTRKFIGNEWKDCICCFPVRDFYQTFKSTGKLKGDVAIATFNAADNIIYGEKISELKKQLFDWKKTSLSVSFKTDVISVKASDVVKANYIDMYKVNRVAYYWDSQQMSENQDKQLMMLYNNVPAGCYGIRYVDYERIAPLVYNTNIELA